MRLFKMLTFIIRIIWILSNIWLMFICLKRFILIVNGRQYHMTEFKCLKAVFALMEASASNNLLCY